VQVISGIRQAHRAWLQHLPQAHAPAPVLQYGLCLLRSRALLHRQTISMRAVRPPRRRQPRQTPETHREFCQPELCVGGLRAGLMMMPFICSTSAFADTINSQTASPAQSAVRGTSTQTSLRTSAVPVMQTHTSHSRPHSNVVSSEDGLYAVALWRGCRCTSASAWGPFWPPMPRPCLLLPRPPGEGGVGFT
jgi:hypothetical protein